MEITLKNKSKTEKSNLIRSYELQQITDLIQFDAYDYKENNTSSKTIAYLRASEVKPKLDKFIHRFLLKNIENGVLEINAKDRNGDPITTNNLDEYLIDCGILLGEKGNFSSPDDGQTRSFNYSMRIETDGDVDINDWERDKKNKLKDNTNVYFAVLGLDSNSDYAQRVYCEKSACTMNFKKRLPVSISICYEEYSKVKKENLKISEEFKYFDDLVEFCLPYFFAQTNFGARSSKGYGSFIMKSLIKDNKNIADDEIFKMKMNLFTNMNVYYDVMSSKFKNMLCNKFYDRKNLMALIWYMSSIIKSGLNIYGSGKKELYYVKGAITTYFLDEKLNKHKMKYKSDKAFIKQNYPLLVKGRKTYDNSKFEHKFTRALLGLNTTMDWDRKSITFSNSDIERYASPIIFKPFNNRLLIIPNDVPKNLLDKEFVIENKGKKTKICVPDNFDIVDFLDYFVNAYIYQESDEINIYDFDSDLVMKNYNLKTALSFFVADIDDVDSDYILDMTRIGQELK